VWIQKITCKTSISTTLEKNDSDRARKTASNRFHSLEGGVASNIIGLLRVVVLQNELVLYALKRLDEAVPTIAPQF